MAKISNNDDKRFTNDDDEIIKEEMDNLFQRPESDKAPDDNKKNKYVKINEKWITKEKLRNIGKKKKKNQKIKLKNIFQK